MFQTNQIYKAHKKRTSHYFIYKRAHTGGVLSTTGQKEKWTLTTITKSCFPYVNTPPPTSLQLNCHRDHTLKNRSITKESISHQRHENRKPKTLVHFKPCCSLAVAKHHQRNRQSNPEARVLALRLCLWEWSPPPDSHHRPQHKYDGSSWSWASQLLLLLCSLFCTSPCRSIMVMALYAPRGSF